MAMGIFAVDDMAGIDVAWRVRQELGHFSDAGRAAAARRRQAVRARPARTEDAARGWYRYDDAAQGDAGSRGDRPDSRDRRGGRRSRSARSPTRRSSSAASTRWSTKARGSSRTARRSAPPTSTSSTSTATAFRRGAAVRCSTPIASASRRILDRIRQFAARATAHAGRRRRCWPSSPESGQDVPRTLDRSTRARSVPMDAPMPPRSDAARILPPDVTRRSSDRGDAVYARSPHPLPAVSGPADRSPRALGRHAPDRPFLAARDQRRALAHASATRRRSTRVRAIAQALLDRALSVDRPIVILSGNSIEHALLALAAMYSGVPYAPIAPAYSLLARQYTTLRHDLSPPCGPGWCSPPTVTASRAALASVCAGRRRDRHRARRRRRCARTAVRRSRAPTADRRPSTTRTRAVGPDTVAKILFTSGSTGIAERRDQHAADAVRQPGDDLRTVLPLLADEPPVLCDWLPWNHTFGGNHNFGIALYNGGTLYIDDGRPMPRRVRDDAREPARDRHHRLLQRAARLRAAAAGACAPTRRFARTSSAG